jgi:hypothetical protein
MQFRTVVLIAVAFILVVTLANAQALQQSTAAAVSQADNSYCGPGDTPNFGGAQDGPAQLPTACIYSALSGTPSPGNVVQLAAGANLQAALNAAQCGDTITLQAGTTFTGSYTLPEGHATISIGSPSAPALQTAACCRKAHASRHATRGSHRCPDARLSTARRRSRCWPRSLIPLVLRRAQSVSPQAQITIA